MPSDRLLKLLTEQGVCTVQDVASCGPLVRRLGRDLPDFDCVWIDALVQRRILTPWQADILQSDSPDLRVADFVLQDAISVTRKLAVTDDRSRQVVLHQIAESPHGERSDSETVSAVRTAVELAANSPKCLALPRDIIDDGEHLWTVSDFVAGYSVEELLIRGGRLPWPTVAEIGRDLLAALRWCETHHLLHGNIRLRNLIITPSGQPVLVGGLFGLTHSTALTYSEQLTLKHVETTAPELIASGASADSQSELYAAGCVLWQLLTARPPFLNADPVQKVLKAQHNDVAAVDDFVPDCPEWMVSQLRSLTRRSPELRPDSVATAAERWKQNAPTGYRSTRRLIGRMPDRRQRRVGRVPQSGMRRRKIGTVFATAVLLCAFVSYGVHRGLVPLPASLMGGAQGESDTRTSQALNHDASVSSGRSPITASLDRSSTAVTPPVKVPAPDTAGVIVLQSGRAYIAEDRAFAGVMYIETTGSAPAVIRVPPDRTWALKAEQVNLSNIRIQPLSGDGVPQNSGPSRQPLLSCQCDMLRLHQIALISAERSGVSWQSVSGLTSLVELKGVFSSVKGYGIHCLTPPQRLDFQNCLFSGSGVPLRIDMSQGATPPAVQMSHVTVRGAASVIDVLVPPESAQRLALDVLCGESVFAVQHAVVRIAGKGELHPSAVSVSFRLPEKGNPVILPPDVFPAVCIDSSLQRLVALSEKQVVADALLLARPIFAAELTDDADQQASRLTDYEGPKLSQQLPGVDVTQLPPLTEVVE